MKTLKKDFNCILGLMCLLIKSTLSFAQEPFPNKEKIEPLPSQIVIKKENIQTKDDINKTDLRLYMQKFPRQNTNISGLLFNSIEIKKENMQNINKEIELDSIHTIGSNSFLLEFHSKNNKSIQSIDVAIHLTNSYETAYMMLLNTVMAECGLFAIDADLIQQLLLKSNSIDYYSIYLPKFFFCFQCRNIVVGIVAKGWPGGAPQELIESVADYIDNYLLNQSLEEGKNDISSKKIQEKESMKNDKNTYVRRNYTHEEKLEEQLKNMPKEEAQKQCLKKAMELSETPDKNAEELLFYLRGLPMVEEDETTRVLHRISSTAKDRKLLESAMQLQGKWLSLYSEPRKCVLDDLSGMLKSDDSRLRRQAIVSLGRSRSLDALPPLFLELEKHPDDREVMSALGKILGWSEDGASLNEERVSALKEQASELLKNLKVLHGFLPEKGK